MTAERQLPAPLNGFADTLLADFPAQRAFDHLVVRIAAAMPSESDDGTLISTVRHAAASIATIPVPLGELDHFSVRRVTDAAAGLVAGTHRSVTFDMSAVSFCDSSIASFLGWADGLGAEIDVTVITSPAIERVLGLLAGCLQ